jgi:hypothetical protein
LKQSGERVTERVSKRLEWLAQGVEQVIVKVDWRPFVSKSMWVNEIVVEGAKRGKGPLIDWNRKKHPERKRR